MLDHMMEDGSLKESDKNGKVAYKTADGAVGYASTYRLNSISVGGFVVHDITVSAMGKGNSYLLGQTFLKQFKSWSIDYARNVLVLVPINAPAEVKPEPKPELHDQVTPSVIAAAAAATGWVRLGVSDHECSGTIDPVAFEKANTGEGAHVGDCKR
jgi:gag-polyprotein putative aspartyl protease